MRPLPCSALLCLLLSAGCSKGPAIYEPPIERRPITGAEPELAEFIEMKSPAARQHIVRDVMDAAPGHPARWTNQNPALRFFVRRAAERRLRIDFVIAHATMKETGPVTITFRVNGKALETVRYDTAGEKSFEKPVSSGWLETGGTATVSMDIDKVWIAKTDGARLGVMLLRAGFLP